MHDAQMPQQVMTPPEVENAKTSVLLDQKFFRGDVVVNDASRIPFKEDGPSLKACVKALESTLILFYEDERTLAPWVVIAEAIVRVDDRDAYLFSVGQGILKAPKFYFKAAISMDNRIYAEDANDELMFYGEIMPNE